MTPKDVKPLVDRAIETFRYPKSYSEATRIRCASELVAMAVPQPAAIVSRWCANYSVTPEEVLKPSDREPGWLKRDECRLVILQHLLRVGVPMDECLKHVWASHVRQADCAQFYNPMTPMERVQLVLDNVTKYFEDWPTLGDLEAFYMRHFGAAGDGVPRGEVVSVEILRERLSRGEIVLFPGRVGV